MQGCSMMRPGATNVGQLPATGTYGPSSYSATQAVVVLMSPRISANGSSSLGSFMRVSITLHVLKCILEFHERVEPTYAQIATLTQDTADRVSLVVMIDMHVTVTYLSEFNVTDSTGVALLDEQLLEVTHSKIAWSIIPTLPVGSTIGVTVHMGTITPRRRNENLATPFTRFLSCGRTLMPRLATLPHSLSRGIASRPVGEPVTQISHDVHCFVIVRPGGLEDVELKDLQAIDDLAVRVVVDFAAILVLEVVDQRIDVVVALTTRGHGHVPDDCVVWVIDDAVSRDDCVSAQARAGVHPVAVHDDGFAVVGAHPEDEAVHAPDRTTLRHQVAPGQRLTGTTFGPDVG